MKILQINKFFYRRGGAESHFFDLIDLLKIHGHTVFPFSQKNPKNEPSIYQKYFISNIELGGFHWSSLFKLGRMFWSFKASRLVKKIIKDQKPDIVHIHNIYHQISPSILPAIKKFGLPIVMTVHDFKLIKPNYTLRTDEKIIQHKNSKLADIIIRLEFMLHRRLKIYQRYVDCFIVPSQFVKDRLAENGFDLQKIIVIPHFAKTSGIVTISTETKPYVLAFGRLDAEKGLDTLVQAWAKIQPTKNKLVIAGDGPYRSTLTNLISDLKITHTVELIGHKNPTEIKKIIQESQFVVVPSKVHETFGLSAMESQIMGKAVVASNAGALPEIVKDGITGKIFSPGNVSELSDIIKNLLDNPELISSMGKNAKETAGHYDSENYYLQLISIYQKLISCSKK